MEFASAIGEEDGEDGRPGKADRKAARYKDEDRSGHLSSITTGENIVAEPRVQFSEAALLRWTHRI